MLLCLLPRSYLGDDRVAARVVAAVVRGAKGTKDMSAAGACLVCGAPPLAAARSKCCTTRISDERPPRESSNHWSPWGRSPSCACLCDGVVRNEYGENPPQPCVCVARRGSRSGVELKTAGGVCVWPSRGGRGVPKTQPAAAGRRKGEQATPRARGLSFHTPCGRARRRRRPLSRGIYAALPLSHVVGGTHALKVSKASLLSSFFVLRRRRRPAARDSRQTHAQEHPPNPPPLVLLGVAHRHCSSPSGLVHCPRSLGYGLCNGD